MPNDTKHNGLRLKKLPRAAHGSKRDWPAIAGQVPQDVYDRLDELAARRQVHKGDLVHEAVALLLEKHAA